MGVYNHVFLIHLDRTVVDLTDSDPSHIFIVVNRTDQNLGRFLRISLRRLDMFNDRIKQRLHIFLLIGKIGNRISALCGREDKRTVQLLIVCVQFHQ